MNLSLHSSPHLQSGNQVNRMMLAVIYALIPGVLAYMHFFGPGVIINITLAVVTALAAEALMLRLRKRPIKPFLMDGSAVVTGILLGVALPSLTPWWLPVLGAGFALIIAKHLYGGLGYNPFNPAMVGYAMLLIAFPREMTLWLTPEVHDITLLDTLRYTFLEQLPAGQNLDALTAATPLDAIKTALSQNLTLTEIHNSSTELFGMFSGHGWEWINLLFMLGGLVLIYMRVISWHIPLAMLATLFLVSGLFHLNDPDAFTSPLFHLFGGATMLGAFFIATDPVTAATTNRGRIIYGIGIGLLLYIIRTWGGYPDAVAFAVLLMNMAVPTIDYYTRPPVFGEGQS
ncbi:electron transport complex subunit RsxD [Thiohalophilus sp.]|uniref:electron transport complex subunit RsxD n=1 Tax=Thiohalophilus sp. TaxID=3028392 RepID=UPI002ACE09E2|nr:electron transport complex subunit RsxD [Thiohalophilus sp.]MDZ7802920.1 electron transport complex subunit RsxD [Thiohalophilus sp.]